MSSYRQVRAHGTKEKGKGDSWNFEPGLTGRMVMKRREKLKEEARKLVGR